MAREVTRTTVLRRLGFTDAPGPTAARRPRPGAAGGGRRGRGRPAARGAERDGGPRPGAPDAAAAGRAGPRPRAGGPCRDGAVRGRHAPAPPPGGAGGLLRAGGHARRPPRRRRAAARPARVARGAGLRPRAPSGPGRCRRWARTRTTRCPWPRSPARTASPPCGGPTGAGCCRSRRPDLISPDPLGGLPPGGRGHRRHRRRRARGGARGRPGERCPAARATSASPSSAWARPVGASSTTSPTSTSSTCASPRPAPMSEHEALAVGTRLATQLARACSAAGAEPALWPVDANLRPEGKDGPLVRTLASHVAYYERWAKGWEFQALIKARPVAGDRALGAAYLEALAPMVWRRRARALRGGRRRRCAGAWRTTCPPRTPTVSSSSARAGCVTSSSPSSCSSSSTGAPTHDPLGHHPRGARAARAGRVRLARPRRRAVPPLPVPARARAPHPAVPAAPHPPGAATRRTCAGWAGPCAPTASTRRGPGDPLRQVRREVRQLHEEIFYRPLLPLTAQLSAEDAADAGGRPRAAAGHRLPGPRRRAAAHRGPHRGAVAGVRRSSASCCRSCSAGSPTGPEPDAGLLAFRELSETMGTTHWYLKLLRDSGAAAERLAQVLSTSRYAADALARLPEAVAWLDDDAELAPRGAGGPRRRARGRCRRGAPTPVPGVMVARYLRRRELLRAALDEVLGDADRSSAPRGSSPPPRTWPCRAR